MKRLTEEGLTLFTGTNQFESLVIETERLQECIRYVQDGKISNILINPNMGFSGESISFLREIADSLKGLHILDSKYNFDEINNLHNLEFLGFPDNGRSVIDLTNFPSLQSLAVDYSVRLSGLSSCKKLLNLQLSNFKPKSEGLLEICGLINLERLSLLSSPITQLLGIENLINLKVLKLFSLSRLTSINALIGVSKHLVEIEINGCKKISNLDLLGQLTNLQKIILLNSGVLSSIEFVTRLPKLEFLSFVGSNVLDGNLEHLKGVKYVGFDDRRHYSHRMKDFLSK